ncbi:hypothetical protein L1987_49080 [Smallanthus sonchifolius]|uniref:Uncharacterized protein n=1 Tax=Smallanthus sonchifolius TaxID=185202 RepID=A0ACB9FVD3_9ASTR|nr:hypothetical protein L1987_49080 [Smallanthus sonchifolius]
MEAALQLMQLSGESDVDVSGHGFSNSSAEVSMKRRRSEEVCDDDESQGSSISDITSAKRRKRNKFRSIVEIYERSREKIGDKVLGLLHRGILGHEAVGEESLTY